MLVQGFVDHVPVDPGGRLFDLDDHVLVVVPFARFPFSQADAGHPLQALLVEGVVTGIDLEQLVEDIQGSQTHRGGDLAHARDRPGARHTALVVQSLLNHPPGRLCEVVVVRDHRPALEGVDELRGVEAEDLGAAEASDRHSPVGVGEGVRRVEE